MKNILLSLFLLSSFIGLAQKKKAKIAEPAKPKLVVGIVVDQMRYDFLYRYESKYGSAGLKRLRDEGFNCKNNQYHYASTVTGPGHCHIFSGSAPAVSGIVGNEWFNRYDNRSVYVVEDSTATTVGEGGSATAGKMSPKNMLVTTITDQLRLSNEYQSKVVGIAFKDRGSILPAGHTGTAYWFDTKNGLWISSSYYMKQLPTWVTNFNAQKFPQKYTEQTWNTLLPIDQYTESDKDDQPYETAISGEPKAVFPHKVTLGSLAQTPFGNTLTKDFAVSAIKNEQLGKGAATDFLTLSFSSPDYAGHAFGPRSVEIEDLYLRFDKDIEDLLNTLDTEVGKGNYLVFLSADHGVAEIPAYLKKNKVPAGILTGTELMKMIKEPIEAAFGKADWIQAEDNYQIYLNHATLKAKNVSVDAIYKVLKAELIKNEGIYNVVNLNDLSTYSVPSKYAELIKNINNPKRSGDIMVLVEPAWFAGYLKGTTHGTMWSYDTHVPLLWYGWKIPKGETSQPTYIADIAPTLAALLNILEPNGSIGKPIEALTK
jgi:predicted AlkP superfamily pyrophosphatase or phosphodiesterase